MNDKKTFLDNVLRHIAREISITQTMISKATDSYTAVGKWIGEGIWHDVHIYPQGSMALGTTNRPITDTDDYDIDLVCLIKDGLDLSEEQIKNIVGDRLKEHDLYRTKILKEGEGKRCWKMQYDEFHMDILPCVPRNIYYLEPLYTEIRLTHKNEEGKYKDRYSNPIGYRRWFEECMGDTLQEEKRIYASQNGVEIQDVPNYRVKTPLQMVVQLLKRHRDICFEKDPNNAPISIIITTLSAKAYSGETNVYEALCNVLDKMADYITMKNGVEWVENPTMNQENFAEKWQDDSEKKTAFRNWLKKAKKELIDDPMAAVGIDQLKKCYAKSLGEAPVTRAIMAMANNTRSAGENNQLYSVNLNSGLTNTPEPGNKRVKKHSFYGK